MNAGARAIENTFQSTRPVRGGTSVYAQYIWAIGISIHPPRAGRDVDAILSKGQSAISIHPPRAGRDGVPVGTGGNVFEFQSTRPVRGGT